MIDIYALGLMALSVCAPSDMGIADVTRAVNEQEPTGIATDWQPDPAPAFKHGEPNPSPCERNSARTHYLYQC